MKKLVNEILFGKNSMVSGIIAIAIISAIGLGCFCNKDKFEGFSNSGSTTPSPSASASPSPSPTKSVEKSDASKGKLPSDDELQSIVKTTLLDFNDAVQKGDFTDFYDKICKPWKKQTSVEKLETSFRNFIDKKVNIGTISSQKAEFSPSPVVERELGYQTLKLQGKYPTKPNYTKFELNYIPEGKDWKLSKIQVDTTETNY
jgi:hypothetical protein